MKKFALALATGSLLIGGAAYAQSARTERAPATRDAVTERTDAMFARMDANGDGVVSDADKAARMAQRFAKMDTNGDGMLSQAEFTAAHEARGEAGAKRMGKRGGRGGQMIERADSNGDGQVTKAELQTAALARFDQADANRDGTISADERQAARQAMRGERRGQ